MNITTLERLKKYKEIYNDLESKGFVIWYNNNTGCKEFGLPHQIGGFIPPTLGYIDNNTFKIIYYRKQYQEYLCDVIDELIPNGKYPFISYTTPNNSIRCYDLEGNNKTLRNENGVILHDNSLLDWLLNLVPSNQ